MHTPASGVGPMVGWYALRSFFALLAFATVVAALALQAQAGVNPALALLNVVVAAVLTFPITQPIIRMMRQMPPMAAPTAPPPRTNAVRTLAPPAHPTELAAPSEGNGD